MASRACKFQIIKSDQIVTIVILQFKTGVRLRLTSSVKELGAIYKNGLKYEPGLIPVNNNDEKHLDDVDGDADVLDWQGAWLGATTETKMVLSRTGKMIKEAVLSLCLVKRMLLKL